MTGLTAFPQCEIVLLLSQLLPIAISLDLRLTQLGGGGVMSGPNLSPVVGEPMTASFLNQNNFPTVF